MSFGNALDIDKGHLTEGAPIDQDMLLSTKRIDAHHKWVSTMFVQAVYHVARDGSTFIQKVNLGPDFLI